MKLIVKNFQRLCYVQLDLDILFVKLIAQIGDCIRNRGLHTLCTLCLRGWGFHAKHVFFCNILNGCLYIDASIAELFQICLVVSQTLEKGIHVFVGVLRERQGSQFSLGGVRTALRFALWDQCQEETMYSAWSQLSYLWDLEEQREGECFKVMIWCDTMQTTKGGQFLWESEGSLLY